VAAGKAVFGVEYSLDPADFHPQAQVKDFNLLAKLLDWMHGDWHADDKKLARELRRKYGQSRVA
jgi:hypothetical protein